MTTLWRFSEESSVAFGPLRLTILSHCSPRSRAIRALEMKTQRHETITKRIVVAVEMASESTRATSLETWTLSDRKQENQRSRHVYKRLQRTFRIPSLKMDVDEALNKLGGFGRWQVIYFVTLGLAVMMPAAFHSLAIVYIGYKPPHRCKIPENSTLNESIPYEGDQLSSCKMFVNYSLGNETTDCLNGWEYLGDDGPTIVTKWDLVCDREVLAQMSQTVLVLGIMLGAVLFTMLSDKYGRKPVFLFSQVVIVVIGVATPFVEDIYVFFFLRFLTGTVQQGILLPGFILMYEAFATKYRTFVGIMVENFWCLAICLYPLLAYLFNDWIFLQVFVSLFGLVLTIPLFRYLPESVMWLCANNRSRKAIEILKETQKINKIKPYTDFRGLIDERQIENSRMLYTKKEFKSRTNYSILDFFKSKILFLHLVVCSILWTITTLVYYGLTLSTAQLDGNRYWNGFFNGLVEFPANLITYIIVLRYGRKWPSVGFWTITGMFLIISSLIPLRSASGADLSILKVVSTMIGKYGVTCSFSILIMYGSELFPTNLRVQAAGISSFFGRMGNFIASFSSYIMEKYPFLMLVTLGILSLFSAVLMLSLPETHNRPLPETIEDLEKCFINPKQKTQNDLVQ